uniref:hypothetical protein n=1 Tax=Peptoniphilus harei TaxID=54005 RepID=UPI0039845A5F
NQKRKHTKKSYEDNPIAFYWLKFNFFAFIKGIVHLKIKKLLAKNILCKKLPCFLIEDLRPKSHCLSDSEFAILEGRDLENINFWNEIFGQELFACKQSVFLYSRWIRFLSAHASLRLALAET